MRTEQKKKYRVQAWIILIVLSIIWGSSFIIIKKSLEVFTAGQVGSIRLVFAFLFLLAFAIPNIKKVPGGKWKYIMYIGVFSIFIPSYLFAIAQTNLSSSLTGILNALTPLFTLIVGIILFKFKMKVFQVIGLLLGFVGCVSLSFINAEGGFGQMNFYVLLVVAATIGYSIGTNIVKARLSEINPTVLASLSMLVIGPIAVVYLFSTDFLYVLHHTEGSWTAMGYLAILGILGTGIALALINRLILITTPIFASSVTYLIPIVAVMWGLIDDEKLFLMHYAGMVLIIVGIYFVNKFR